jgi:hypothetical protein
MGRSAEGVRIPLRPAIIGGPECCKGFTLFVVLMEAHSRLAPEKEWLMELIEKRSYKSPRYGDKEFTLRLYATEGAYQLAGFLEDEQVTPRYGVDLSTATDYFRQFGDSLMENLFEYAQADIDHGLCLI